MTDDVADEFRDVGADSVHPLLAEVANLVDMTVAARLSQSDIESRLARLKSQGRIPPADGQTSETPADLSELAESADVTDTDVSSVENRRLRGLARLEKMLTQRPRLAHTIIRPTFEHPRYDERTKQADIHRAQKEAMTGPEVNVVTDISGGDRIRKEAHQRIEAIKAELVAAVALQIAELDKARLRYKQHEQAFARYQDDLKDELATLAARPAAGLSDKEIQRVEGRIDRLRAQRHVEGMEIDRAQRDIDRIAPEVKRLVTTAQGNAAEEGKLAEVRLSLYWHEFLSHIKDRDRVRWVLQATGDSTPQQFITFDMPSWVRQAWEDYLQ